MKTCVFDYCLKNYSDDEIMSPGLIDEYNNLTDTLV